VSEEGRLTTSQINRLGARLRHSAEVSEDDLDLLQDLRSMHAEALVKVQEVLARELGVRPTSRLKTVGTIVDKLRREPTMSLSRMQDIAGLRIVEDMDRLDQEQLARRIAGLFLGSKTVDRRRQPSYGYRAIHVIVPIDVCWVEVQVRTRLQDLWAQLVERLGDAWGRQIRYGGEPDEPERAIRGTTRGDVWELVRDLAEHIDNSEEVVATLTLAERGELDVDEDLRSLDRETVHADAQRLLERIGKALGNLREL
jgi:ppGpp synthetase/RelA/SpoT-type nucleotidyltranferase